MNVKKHIYILLASALCFSCVEQDLPFQEDDKNTEYMIELDFSHKNFSDIQFGTKATLPSIAEAKISNLTVFLFTSSGVKQGVVSYGFSNRKLSMEEYHNTQAACWVANEYDPDQLQYTNGKCKSPISTSMVEGRIYVIANLEDDIFNVSQTSITAINVIDTEQDLMDFIYNYKSGSESTFRMGNFLMVGWADMSIIDGQLHYSGGTYRFSQSGSGEALMLERADAKVSVTVGVVPGAVTQREENGQTVSEEIESFVPTYWQVCRLPKKSKLINSGSPFVSASADDYFDSSIHYFETSTSDAVCEGFVNGVPATMTREEFGFGFYMLENRQTTANGGRSVYDPTAAQEYGMSGYHLREKRTKQAAGSAQEGTYSPGDMWEFAPENATYLKIRGRVRMKYNNEIVATSQTLEADVTYYVHLGNFVASDSEDAGQLFDSYSVDRNTHYTYTINIKGVNSIQVEVLRDVDEYSPSNEVQPGSTGFVSVTQEQIYTFDSHFGQRVYKFNANDILASYKIDKLTFYVSTPFGRAGSPDLIDGTMIPNGIDYKWVHFLRNSKDETYIEAHGGLDGGPLTVTNGRYPYYSNNSRIWPGMSAHLPQDPNGDGLMDIIQLCSYLRTQLRKYENSQPSDFDANGDLYVTAFVDEFYYESSPISANPLGHWASFVNQPMRTIHILCDSKFSKDGESAQTGSAVTIQQRSLQTIFNSTSPEGWATEYEDETRNGLWFFNTNERRGATITRSDIPATTKDNGLYNSAVIWGLLNPDGSFKEGVPWSRYLDYVRPNDYVPASTVNNAEIGYLRDDPEIATMRYACLSRNRDEDGDGLIDKDEIKWYMASLQQLQYLFIGDLGLEGKAQLYSVNEMSNSRTGYASGNDYWKWRAHVLCSTIPQNNGVPTMIWAEEGCSTSDYGKDNGWNKPGAYSQRCVRNLDQVLAGGSGAYTVPKDLTDRYDVPESPIVITENADGTYTFDLGRLNSQSKRIKTSSELVPMDENSVTARPYEVFTTGEMSPKTLPMTTYPVFRSELMRGVPGASGCPQGYRVPNVREMTIMHLSIPANSAFWGSGQRNFITCNYYSFGAESSTNFDNQGARVYSWAFNPKQQHISLDASVTGYIRCVRDVGGDS